MKKSVLTSSLGFCVLVLLGITLFLPARAQQWTWADSPGHGCGNAVTVDAGANVYAGGGWGGPGPAWVTKRTNSGTPLWTTHAGPARGYAASEVLAVDMTGNVYVAGVFNDMVTFGATTLNAGSRSNDLFVAKLTPTGTWEWAVRVGLSGHGHTVMPTGLLVDGYGDVVVSGYFEDTLVTFGATTLTSPSGGLFVAKLSPAGIWQWAVSAPASALNFSFTHVYGAALAPGGAVVVTGTFRGTAVFGQTTLTSAGKADVFVAKVSPTGVWQWATSGGGREFEGGADVAVDASGRIYVTGSFPDTIQLGGTTLISAGDEDAFVARLTPAGTWEWAQQAGGSDNDFGKHIAVGPDGHVLVMGHSLSDTLALGTTILSQQDTSISYVGRILYVAKLTDQGDWEWGVGVDAPMSITGQVETNDLAVDPGGAIFVTGGFDSPTITFGATTLLNQAAFPDPGVQSFYLARLDQPVLATGEEQPGATLELFPNPARDRVRLRSALPGGTRVAVLDGLGRQVSTAILTADGSAGLELAGLSPGIYVVRCGGVARRLVVL